LVARWLNSDGRIATACYRAPSFAPEWYGGQFASWDLGPDGEQVAVRRLDEGAGGTLWIRNLVRGDERVVTQDGDSMNPIWSPAGDSLVFASARGRPPDLFRTVLRDGTEELLTGGPAAMFPQSWDPTRDWIVYAFGDPQSGGDLWRLSLEDGGIEPLPLNTGFDEGDGQVSPDGRWIAYVSNASGERRVVLAGFPSGQPRCPVSVGGGSVPRWRADGRELYYVSAGRQLMAVEVAPGDGACLLGSPEPLFPLLDERNDDVYAPASDGQRFLFLTRAEDADVLPLRVILNWPALAEE
jgi:dipeptidyl aminopeptidase/acylaminoacyl peptidase